MLRRLWNWIADPARAPRPWEPWLWSRSVRLGLYGIYSCWELRRPGRTVLVPLTQTPRWLAAYEYWPN